MRDLYSLHVATLRVDTAFLRLRRIGWISPTKGFLRKLPIAFSLCVCQLFGLTSASISWTAPATNSVLDRPPRDHKGPWAPVITLLHPVRMALVSSLRISALNVVISALVVLNETCPCCPQKQTCWAKRPCRPHNAVPCWQDILKYLPGPGTDLRLSQCPRPRLWIWPRSTFCTGN